MPSVDVHRQQAAQEKVKVAQATEAVAVGMSSNGTDCVVLLPICCKIMDKAKINMVSENYRVVANRGSLLPAPNVRILLLSLGLAASASDGHSKVLPDDGAVQDAYVLQVP